MERDGISWQAQYLLVGVDSVALKGPKWVLDFDEGKLENWSRSVSGRSPRVTLISQDILRLEAAAIIESR
jgi:hypothetical protein